jgi:hypothetical protein
MPDLHVLTSDQKPIDQNNNIVLTEVVRPGRGMEYTVTVLIDGTAIAVSGPFLTLDEAVDQANEQARHASLLGDLKALVHDVSRDMVEATAPFVHAEDRARLIEGLARAGL